MRLAIALLVLVGAAFADGGMVVPPDVAIEEYGQVAIIRYLDGTEQLSVATSFRSEATDFSWILPLPAEPAVDSFQLSLLDELQYFCRPLYRTGSGFGCASEVSESGVYNSDSLGVEQIERGTIGTYSYQVLRTSEPETLAAYLRNEGYALPDSAASVFSHYTAMNWQYFVVARSLDSTGLGYYRSVGIRLTFAADSAVYPMYISRLSSAYSGVVLYVVADHRQLFPGATLLFSGRVDHGSFPTFPGFVDRPGRLTKLLKYYDTAGMEDVYLRSAPDDKDYRVVQRGYVGFYGALSGLVPLLGIVVFARRRRGRPRSL
ncbi:MAG TPA: DUF2330 domain-containing protein [bacterium]|nr:DUF2330 domain-containing protein [bacterium]